MGQNPTSTVCSANGGVRVGVERRIYAESLRSFPNCAAEHRY